MKHLRGNSRPPSFMMTLSLPIVLDRTLPYSVPSMWTLHMKETALDGVWRHLCHSMEDGSPAKRVGVITPPKREMER